MGGNIIKTTKKDKGVWKSLGGAVLAVGSLVIAVLADRKKNQ